MSPNAKSCNTAAKPKNPLKIKAEIASPYAFSSTMVNI
jgi:hypothetical protein